MPGSSNVSERLRALVADHEAAVAELAERQLSEVEAFARLLWDGCREGRRVLTFGNGGSAADAQHLAAELIGHFKRDRVPLAAQSISTDPSVMTAIANDYAWDDVFARQVEALAQPGDVCVGYTTSGESKNVVRALEAARARGATTVAVTGRRGGLAARVADRTMAVPADDTARVQELHLLITHLVSELIDDWATADDATDGTNEMHTEPGTGGTSG
jgi:D-sedoheptulose 7-phosphate isomerase